MNGSISIDAELVKSFLSMTPTQAFSLLVNALIIIVPLGILFLIFLWIKKKFGLK